MANIDIKNEMRSLGVRQWEVAQYLGISEATMYRKMRSELDPEFRETVLDAIQALGNPPGYGKILSAGSSAVVDK